MPPITKVGGKGSRPDGPIVQLTRFWKIVLAAFLGALGFFHLVWTDLGIDAISIGLFIGGLGLLFFDIDGFEWQGIKARRLIQEVREADEAVRQVTISSSPSDVLIPPEAAPILVDSPVGDIVHAEADELLPPLDLFQRVLWGHEHIRLELAVLAGSGGYLSETTALSRVRSEPFSLLLAQKNILPAGLVEPIATISRLRNEIAHARGPIPSELLRSAADLAMDVLHKLLAVPRTYVRVAGPDVELFEDRSLSAKINVPGVMLVQVREGGEVVRRQVFPRGRKYVRGRFVTWEWDFDHVVNEEAWYRDPASGEARSAFGSAATFIGREFPTQWGLEFRLPNADAGL